MNTNSVFVRLMLALMLVLGLLGVSAKVVLATPPEHFSFPVVFTETLPDLCAFPVDITVESTVSGKAYFDKDGNLYMVLNHITEVDTLTANGKTVVGLPFTYNIQVHFDAEENPVSWHGTGVVIKFVLPDGSLLISAGFTDWLAHVDDTIVLGPDHGKSGDVALLCAALTP